MHMTLRAASRTLAAAALMALAALCTACGQSQAGHALGVGRTAALPVSRSSHVAIILMENKEISDVIASSAATYTNALARSYGLATQSYGVTHPSLPNYLALTSGSTHGVT